MSRLEKKMELRFGIRSRHSGGRVARFQQRGSMWAGVAMDTARFGACVLPVRWVIVSSLLLLALISSRAATFTATLDRNAISVGESATLSLSVEGGAAKQVPNFRAAAGLSIQSLGESRNISIVNGAMNSSLSYNYQVTATQPGDYTIPAIRIQVGDEVLTSAPLRLHVTKGNAQTSLAFLKLICTNDTAYLGQVFPVELQLYLGANGDNLQLPQIEGDGFVFSKMPQQPTQGNTQVGNQMYRVVTFRCSAVAAKVGDLTLGPAQCSLVLQVPVNARGRSIFDDFFGGFQRKPVTLTSETNTIHVLPLPKEGQPPDFNGAVGDFSFAASASPTNIAVGDPITVRAQVMGSGNLDALPFPGGTDWREFKLYPPTSKVETTDPAGISGVKTFERVVIPQDPSIRELPAITFSFFDPERKAYRTAKSAPVPIQVRPSDTAAPQPTVLANSRQAQEAIPTVHDIVHIKPYLGTIVTSETPLVLRPWFLALQGIPVLAWVSALVWRIRREQLENNPKLRRRRQVAEAMRKGLRELAQLAQANEGDAFFATIFHLLQEQLGERLDLPASAITEAVVDERLRPHVSETLADQVHELFQICNQARYAPLRSRQELAALVPKVEAALAELRDLSDTVSLPAQGAIR